VDNGGDPDKEHTIEDINVEIFLLSRLGFKEMITRGFKGRAMVFGKQGEFDVFVG